MIGPLTDDILESASDDLAEARGKIDVTRKALEAALGGQDDATVRLAITRQEHIAEELKRVEIGLPVANNAWS